MQDQSQKLKQLITELCDLEGLAIDKRNHYYDSFLSIYKDHGAIAIVKFQDIFFKKM